MCLPSEFQSLTLGLLVVTQCLRKELLRLMFDLSFNLLGTPSSHIRAGSETLLHSQLQLPADAPLGGRK